MSRSCLHVDGDRWRAHLRQVAAATPGLVPVAKGNGYGFTLGRLARQAAWLGADTLAVGTYDELPQRRRPLRRRPAGAHAVATAPRRRAASTWPADRRRG